MYDQGIKNIKTSKKMLSQKVDNMRGKRKESYLEEAKENSGMLAKFYTLIWVVVTQMLAL